jgi:hypothetical protein
MPAEARLNFGLLGIDKRLMAGSPQSADRFIKDPIPILPTGWPLVESLRSCSTPVAANHSSSPGVDVQGLMLSVRGVPAMTRRQTIMTSFATTTAHDARFAT